MHKNLPKKYYFIDKFNKRKIDKLNFDTAIIYRKYSKKIEKKLIVKIRNYCKKKKIKFFLSNNIKLAIKLDLDGAYIPSFNKNIRHLNYKLKKNFLFIGSAHSISEMRMKELQNVKQIFLSSLFKKNKNYLGINKFKIFSGWTNKEIIALGGISKRNIKYLNIINCAGIAGISYFE